MQTAKYETDLTNVNIYGNIIYGIIYMNELDILL